MDDQISADLSSLRLSHEETPARASSWRSVAVALLAVGVVGSVGVYGAPRLRDAIRPNEVAVAEIAMISPVQASVTVTATGYVQPQRISKIGARIPGRVSRVMVKEGDTVKAGDLIVELESADQVSAVRAADARVTVARARANTARANLAEIAQQVRREHILVQAGAVPRASFDDLVARQRALARMVAAANAEVKASMAEGDTVKVGLGDRAIRAPIDGTLLGKPVEAGELVGPMAAAIAEIADFESLLAEVDVPEARLHLIKIGAPCEIQLDAYPDKRYGGEVVELGKRVDRAKASIRVKVKFVSGISGVLPDMSARVSFMRERISEEALHQPPKRVVAASAVVERNGHKVVFVVDKDAVHAVVVTPGSRIGNGVELVDGPSGGTRIVIEPPPGMKDGQTIREKKA